MGPVIHRPALPIPLPLARGGLGAITAAGGRTTLGLGTAALEDYADGSFTATATGFSGTAPTGTVLHVQLGNMLLMVFPWIGGTSNATTFTLTGLPAGFWPPAELPFQFRATDNTSVITMGMMIIAVTGVITLYSSLAGAPWTASGVKAYNGGTVLYIL